jgi:hypothetical protein
MATKTHIAVPTEDFPQYAADQITAIWREMVRLKARNDAFRHIFDALVVTHPKPEAIAELLAAVRPELVDDLVPGGEPSDLQEIALATWAHELAHVDQMVKAVIDARKD